jgi:hypothetical protein
VPQCWQYRFAEWFGPPEPVGVSTGN